MTDRYNDKNSGAPAFDPNSQGQGQIPTQGQGQGQYNVDPANRGDLADSEIRSEGRGPTQQQRRGQYDPAARSVNIPGGDPNKVTIQSADPEFDHHDPARGRFDYKTRFSGPGVGQDRSQLDQQGQWRQGGQTAGENIPHGGGGRDHPRHGGRVDQVVDGPQENFDARNCGTSTSTGPGSRPDDQEIRGDGSFGVKPPMTERVIGTAEKIVGKATGNPKMYEHGQRHKSEGY